jgi:cytochrome b561
MCGVEMHLDDLVESIHQVRSNRIHPYLNHNRQEICEKCALLHSSICPCPMDYLAVLLVGCIVLHVLAALYHQFVRKDRLFRRMWFGRRV